ncbi:succinate dehydrogenase subunit C [Desulfotomaculum arcticum]|uniref:Succinate dehydrogenase subunit C n=1 Tax=Desulfotruncus arcticus DSM 17038 TaxID=1121424 RepID=A0A1I2YQN1_9FIRM|nr:succinate dehydrogenase, cytochrome b556 subunit [Desulfotruncus arcticus]SFH27386.1 succinate dehydrogenase subunit C [Desulfotomaculum arcticum] [Desulfotruncus arcticus DSM 17038]
MPNREMAVSQRYATHSQVWGAVGMWAWILHRITGIGLVLYLLLHATLMAFSLIKGNEAFNAVLTALMTNPVLHYMELLLVGAIIYHGLNGIRLLLFDIGIGFTRQKEIFWVAMVLGAALWIYVMMVKLS